ncbi:NAD(P)-dependent oxidoreductase [Lentisphaerota bacterium WC36G]|nr:NAD(P)-binding domain-containing protein [Lentisphaerae bacterium WC36]
MKKVLIPTKLDGVSAAILQDKGFNVIQDADTSLETLAAQHADTEVIIVRSEKVTAEIIDSLPQLKLVVRAGAGYNTIDIKYARKNNVDVMNTPGANSNAVAEEVVAMMLAGARHIVKADISTRAGLWEKAKFMGTEITNKTIGIIGLGNIGRLVAKRLEGFEMTVLGYDPFISASLAENMNIKLASVEEIFAQCDYISLHIPENDETRGMVNKKLFESMKDGAAIVNCARHGVINEDDLRAVKATKDIKYLNDVYQKDAAGEKSITDCADLMLPHLGASTKEANFNAAKRAADQTVAYFEEGVTNCVVNKAVPEGMNPEFQKLAYALSSLARNYLGNRVQPQKIEASFYGQLNDFGKWLIAPITAGITKEVDPYVEANDALEFLNERGIEFIEREADPNKSYKASITIDLFEGSAETINKVSVRGTITEGNLMISRINKFDKLYLEPTGTTLFVEYNDAPGVMGKITSILGRNNINIVDLRAPQDLESHKSLAVIKTNVDISGEIVQEIKETVNATAAFVFNY